MEINYTEIVLSIITIVGSIVAGVVAKYVNRKDNTEKIKQANELYKQFQNEFYLKQTWAQEAVAWAQQKFWDEKGAIKYASVREVISNKAKEYNIDISPSEMQVLIESALYQLKTTIGDVIEKENREYVNVASQFASDLVEDKKL